MGEVLHVTDSAGNAGAPGSRGSRELLASVPAPVLRSFRERLLGPLAEYDRQNDSELLPTLRSFLACHGSWSACARTLYVHVNTVRYRIRRIEVLTGRDLSALPDLVDFFLAVSQEEAAYADGSAFARVTPA